MRLSTEDIALLRMLDDEGSQTSRAADSAADAPDGAPAQTGSDATSAAPITEAPRSMFEFNLVSRLPSGALQLTKTGARALFQAECISALEMAAAGTRPEMAGGVERWLVSSGFLHAVERSVTARGKLWLASLSPGEEAAPASSHEQAADHAARCAAPSVLSN